MSRPAVERSSNILYVLSELTPLCNANDDESIKETFHCQNVQFSSVNRSCSVTEMVEINNKLYIFACKCTYKYKYTNI